MRKAVIYKIIGVVIVLFWLFVLAELVKRTSFDSTGVDFAHIDEKRSIGDGSEEWMEIFVKGHKAGYTVTRVKKVNKGFEVKEEIFLAVDLMGSAREILSYTTAQVDERFLLNNFEFSLSSGLIKFNVSGKMEGNNLHLLTGEKGKEETRLIRLPSKPMIGATMTKYFKSSKLKVGESFTLPVFDPISMTTNPAIIKVVAKENIKLDDKVYRAFRLEMNFLGRPLVFWLDEKGVSLKEKGFMGFTLVRSTPYKAKLGLDRPKGIDFYELSAIKVARKLKNPRELVYLKVLFDQTPPSLPIECSRQTINGRILSIQKETPPFKAFYAIPYSGNDNKLLNHLKPEMLIQSEDEEIITVAKNIVRKTADPFLAAKMILGWVFENLEKLPVVSIPDAKEILKNRRGDCNEHATILTALLRAVGIPARIVVGLVYKDGKFYYHAWNEAYIDRWISMDATLKQMPVDATHIKLINGGIEEQIRIVEIIGTLKFTILDYR